MPPNHGFFTLLKRKISCLPQPPHNHNTPPTKDRYNRIERTLTPTDAQPPSTITPIPRPFFLQRFPPPQKHCVLFVRPLHLLPVPLSVVALSTQAESPPLHPTHGVHLLIGLTQFDTNKAVVRSRVSAVRPCDGVTTSPFQPRHTTSACCVIEQDDEHPRGSGQGVCHTPLHAVTQCTDFV